MRTVREQLGLRDNNWWIMKEQRFDEETKGPLEYQCLRHTGTVMGAKLLETRQRKSVFTSSQKNRMRICGDVIVFVQ